MLQFSFWLLVVLSVFSYFLYPLSLEIFRTFRARTLKLAASPLPSISLIVTAYNEQSRIEQKILNSLNLHYPGPLELIVASDCSEDATDTIVKSHSAQGVKLVRAQARLGKENAQLTAIQEAAGEILVFSDVATEIPSDALVKLAAYFTDPAVGAVSSEDRFISQNGTVAGEGAYVKYEMWLRKLESELEGLVGLSGSFFAARRSVCQQWDIHSPSDFNTALNAAKAGLRAVSAPDVLGFYQDLKDPSKEYARKVRTVIRGMTGLSRHKLVLNPIAFGLFAYQVFGHKLMRWLTPWFLILLLIVSGLVAHVSAFYGIALFCQLVFYGTATCAHFLPSLRNFGPVKIIYFFVQVNIALLDAAIKFLAGHRMSIWNPSAR